MADKKEYLTQEKHADFTKELAELKTTEFVHGISLQSPRVFKKPPRNFPG